jgi:hypothetical protein
MLLGDVSDQLLDDDRFPGTGTAKHANLTALGEGSDEIDNLHAGLKNLRRRH